MEYWSGGVVIGLSLLVVIGSYLPRCARRHLHFVSHFCFLRYALCALRFAFSLRSLKSLKSLRYSLSFALRASFLLSALRAMRYALRLFSSFALVAQVSSLFIVICTS